MCLSARISKYSPKHVFYDSISFDVLFIAPPDNSYSWLTSKNVELTLRFTPPVSELEAGGNDEDDAKADLP